jgi:enamine deaminase RidA (YjgF/YER057c/UK114 family)
LSELINPPELPPPAGFSHAVKDTIAEQFDQAAANLLTALRAAGGEADDLVSLQVFVTAVAEYRDSLPALAPVWRRHFGRRYPAMGLFGVTELFDPGAKVELMGVAVLSPGP